MENRGKELAEAHWKYIEELLVNVGNRKQGDPFLDTVKFLYISTAIHFYKHGREDWKQSRPFVVDPAVIGSKFNSDIQGKPGELIITDKKGRRVK